MPPAAAPSPGKAPIRPKTLGAARPNAQQLLAALEGTYRRFASLRAQGSTATSTRADGRMVGKPEDVSVTMLFARPNKVSLSTNVGRFITDGKSVYNYFPSRKEYAEGKMSREVMRQLAMARPGISVLGLVLGVPYDKVVASPKLLADTTIKGREVYVLRVRLKSGVAIPKGVDATETLWIGKSDLGLYRTEVLAKYKPKPSPESKGKIPRIVETTTTVTLSRFEPNAKIAASAFKFHPPAGAKLVEQPKVVDMSDKPAPELSLTWSDGTTKKLSDFRDKVVVLDFWGLPICEQQLPILQSLSEKYKDVQVVAVNVNTKHDKVAEYLKKKGFNFPVVFADAQTVKTARDDYKVTILPTMFIIDRQGIIREEFVGIAKQNEIEPKLDKVVGR